ncbi:hypothetical protein ACIA5D_29745 [Actinoplanes sp. NPDC051513]|uniref:hypothetical protein n=1 Tax=Actinoplanes sp. NPDC051513 TaxID=3363908 RepID=UPI0037A1C9A0
MLGLSIAMAIPSVHGRSDGLVRLGVVSYKVALVVMFAMFAVMILLALGRLSWLRWPWLTTLGALTYPVYLLHRQLGWVAVDQLHESTSSVPPTRVADPPRQCEFSTTA